MQARSAIVPRVTDRRAERLVSAAAPPRSRDLYRLAAFARDRQRAPGNDQPWTRAAAGAAYRPRSYRPANVARVRGHRQCSPPRGLRSAVRAGGGMGETRRCACAWRQRKCRRAGRARRVRVATAAAGARSPALKGRGRATRPVAVATSSRRASRPPCVAISALRGPRVRGPRARVPRRRRRRPGRDDRRHPQTRWQMPREARSLYASGSRRARTRRNAGLYTLLRTGTRQPPRSIHRRAIPRTTRSVPTTEPPPRGMPVLRQRNAIHPRRKERVRRNRRAQHHRRRHQRCAPWQLVDHHARQQLRVQQPW